MKTRIVDEKFYMLFCKKFRFSKNLTKYEDEKIFDMYDHNFFFYKKDITLNQLIAAQKYQENKKRDFLELNVYTRLPKQIKEVMGLEEGITITMMHTPNKGKFIINDKVVIKPISLKDLNTIELKHYGKVYGEDFVKRRNKAFIEESKKDRGFKYYGAYINGKIVGSFHTFTYEDYTVVDSVLVDNRHRHKYICSTMIKYIIDHSETVYLHSDKDETPRKMYKKMGFKVVDEMYEYYKHLDE